MGSNEGLGLTTTTPVDHTVLNTMELVPDGDVVVSRKRERQDSIDTDECPTSPPLNLQPDDDGVLTSATTATSISVGVPTGLEPSTKLPKLDTQSDNNHLTNGSAAASSHCTDDYLYTTEPSLLLTSSDSNEALKWNDDSIRDKRIIHLREQQAKKRVSFDGVTLYYFERSQGFACVPSLGGTTLGMSSKHHTMRRLSLGDHEVEVKRQQRRLSLQLTTQLNEENEEDDGDSIAAGDEAHDGDDDCEEEVEDETETEQPHTSEIFEGSSVGVNQETSDNIGVSTPLSYEFEAETPEEREPTDPFDGVDEADGEQYYPQPLMARERRALLRSAGVRVEPTEFKECQSIRRSRQICGCSCRERCEPTTCACAADGIKCQVDRPSFPCGCTAEGCGNPSGRVEFNALRVRSHYFNIMMRLKHDEQRAVPSPTPKHFRFDEEGVTSSQPQSYCDSQQQQHQLSGYYTTTGVAATQQQQQHLPSFNSLIGYMGSGGGSGGPTTVSQSGASLGLTSNGANARQPYWNSAASHGTSEHELPYYSNGHATSGNGASSYWQLSANSHPNNVSPADNNHQDNAIAVIGSGADWSSSASFCNRANGETATSWPLASLYMHHQKAPVARNGSEGGGGGGMYSMDLPRVVEDSSSIN